ncbi:hypothetical protein N8T08_001098 [Aspergillus melleus]|uniref:Uncharacterized protein n=1 Tax=Aspergillus melleus TaxID=138277 RepID=A0ACC3APN9_9EURO|nr:hypothetical protein N8T08_001098 [Aspergillus melleus]
MYHIAWYVGNAKQAASFYVTRMGFKHIAYRGPETGSRVIVSYVVSNGDADFVLTSPNCAPGFEWDDHVSEEDADLLDEIHDHLTKHGDGVKDVAFRINGDIKAVWKKAVGHGATSISPTILHKNGHGSITLATIGTYADTAHSLVNREP